MHNVFPSKLKYLQSRANFLKCKLKFLTKSSFFLLYPKIQLKMLGSPLFPYISSFYFPLPFFNFQDLCSPFSEGEHTMGTYFYNYCVILLKWDKNFFARWRTRHFAWTPGNWENIDELWSMLLEFFLYCFL